MANQPKKYTKFVATAATATLVASAIVPVASASFTDVSATNSHAANIDALVEAGIIKGYTDGTFKPSTTLTRGHVVKMLGKWVEAQGFEIPADYATKARFTDVAVDAVDQELVKYAALVFDAKVFNGSNGALNAKGNISRENMALVLDRAYKAINGTSLVELAAGSEDLVVTDLASAKGEAKEAIQALRNLGISNVDTFAPKSTVTRGQFASFLNRAINVTPVELTVKAAVAVDAKTLNVTLSDDTTHVVKLDKALEANVATEVTFTIGEKQYTSTVTFKVEAPVVTGVTIVDGLTVEVKFSEAVDKKDANKNKVDIQNVTFDTAELSTDGKTLTLTANEVIEVKDAAVIVEPIQTVAKKLVKTAKYVSVVTYKDEVAPTIVSVKAETNGKTATSAVVKLSEAVKPGFTAKVNGVSATATETSGDTITLTGLKLEAGKTHTVEFFNMTDAAGNKTVQATKTFEVTVDTATPTATVEAAGDYAVLVTFDKKMDEASVKAALSKAVIKDELLQTVTSDAATVVANTDSKQFLVKLNAGSIFADKDTRTFSVVLDGTMKDSLGNKFVASTKSVTLTKDAVKPVATGYDIVVDKDGKVESIVVEFNEALKAAAKGSINFASMTTVVNEQGKIDTQLDTLVNEKIEEGSKKVTFNFETAKEITGKLAVSFAKDLVSDMALVANQSAAFNMTFDFGTGKTVTEFKIATAVTTSGDVITVTFPEKVKGGSVAGSATDVANYTLGGKALPEGTAIVIADDQLSATITLPEGGIAKDNAEAVFTVANVKNVEGTKTVKAYDQTISILDTVAPVLTSAVVVDGSTIELTFDENVAIASSTATSTFIVKVGDTSVTASVTAGTVTSFDNKVKLTFNSTTLDLNETITVETVASGAAITDASGNKNILKDAIKVTVSPKQ